MNAGGRISVRAVVALLLVAAGAEAVVVGTLSGSIRQLNPYAARTPEEVAFGRLVYGGGLVKADPAWPPSLALAEGFSVSDDSLRWVVRLRPGVAFSDGTILTSADVVTTYSRVLESRRLGGSYSAVSRVEADGLWRVVFTLSRAAPQVLVEIASLPVVPAHVYGSVPIDEWGGLPDVGCGPYRSETLSDGTVRLTARGGGFGETPVAEVAAKPFASTARLVAAVFRDEVDAAELPNPADAAELDRADPRVIVSNAAAGYETVWVLAFNGRRPPFDDPAMREQLVKAIDRSGAAREAFGAMTSVPDGPYPQLARAAGERAVPWTYDPRSVVVTLGSWGYYDFDGDGAVERAGVPLRFNLLYEAGSSTSEVIARALKLNFQAIGAEVVPDAALSSDAWRRVFDGRYDMAVLRLRVPPRVDAAWRLFHSEGPDPFGLRDRDVDRAVERVIAAATPERPSAFARLHTAVARTRKLVFIAQPWRSFVAISAAKLSEASAAIAAYPGIVGR